MKAKDFYVDFLGFAMDWQHRFENGLLRYVQISKDCCILYLSEHHGDGSLGTALRIETNELDAFQRNLLAKRYPYARPGIQETPWGSRDMSIRDPFGNRLTFTDAMSIDDRKTRRAKNNVPRSQPRQKQS